MTTTTWVLFWVVVFAVVFAANLYRWAGPEIVDLQKRLLPGMEPWTEEERRKFNRGVVIRALLFASVFTVAAGAFTRVLVQS